jgi:hypothetical protein
VVSSRVLPRTKRPPNPNALAVTLDLSYSCALFYALANVNSFRINKMRTLYAKYRGWGYTRKIALWNQQHADSLHRTLFRNELLQRRFLRPLFSACYKSLFPQALSLHIHTKPPGVSPQTLLARRVLVSKMPAVKPFLNIRRAIVCLAAFALCSTGATALAQTPLAQPRAAVIVAGTVRDPAGTPIADVSVIFEEKATAASIDAKTAADGTFSFLSLRAGTYFVRARKQLDLVLSPIKASPHTKKQPKVSSQ